MEAAQGGEVLLAGEGWEWGAADQCQRCLCARQVLGDGAGLGQEVLPALGRGEGGSGWVRGQGLKARRWLLNQTLAFPRVSSPKSPRNSWMGRRGKSWRVRSTQGHNLSLVLGETPVGPWTGVQESPSASLSPAAGDSGSHVERRSCLTFGEVQLKSSRVCCVGAGIGMGWFLRSLLTQTRLVISPQRSAAPCSLSEVPWLELACSSCSSRCFWQCQDRPWPCAAEQ